MISVAVIIPYFQKREGILQRALNSVLQQRLPANTRINVIVIDDGSPVPAKMETQYLTFAEPFHLTIIEQSNAGVGAARNAGLKSVDKDTTYIAFLDSDDIWKPEYLNNAITGLEKGYDFYFCDSKRLTDKSSTFTETFFDKYMYSKNAQDIGDGYFTVEKNTFFDHSIRGRAYRIPAIVYRYSVARDLTFDPSLRVAGEDCLFLFELIEKCRRICCTTQLLVTFADGVNIYAGSFGWNNPAQLTMYMGQLLAYYQWRKKLALNEATDRFVAKRIKNVRRLFAFLTIRYTLKFRTLWPSQLIGMTREDPLFWLWYPFYAFYIGICYPLRLYDPLKKWD